MTAQYFTPSPNNLVDDHLLMCDRIHATVPFQHGTAIRTATVNKVSPEGELIKQTYVPVQFNTEDTDEFGIKIRSVWKRQGIEVWICPAKLLSGHNLYGSSDVAELLFQSIRFALLQLSDSRLVEAWDAQRPTIPYEKISLLGLDFNATYDLGSSQAVHDWRAYAVDLVSMGNLKADKFDNTLYFGDKQHSPYAWRMYDKYIERLDKGKVDHLTTAQHFYMTNRVRSELILTARGLEALGLTTLYDLAFLQPYKHIYQGYIERMTINNDITIDDIDALDDQYRATFLAWRSGIPLERIFRQPMRRTRHKKAILESLGIDISKPYSSECALREVRLPNLKDMTPVGLPEWDFASYKTSKELSVDVSDFATVDTHDEEIKEEDQNQGENCTIEATTADTTTKNRPVSTENELVIRFHRGDLDHERQPNLRLQAITKTTDGKHLSSSSDRQHNQRTINSYG